MVSVIERHADLLSLIIVALPGILLGVVITWLLARHGAAKETEHRKGEEERRKKDEERRRVAALAREEEARRQQRQAYEADQKRRRDQAQEVASQATSIAQQLSDILEKAENALTRAENEFSEGAFTPFWDEIELAVENLIRFDEGLQLILQKNSQFEKHVSGLQRDPPSFDLGQFTIPDAEATVARMRSIVRNAQKSPYFAMLYEQRRTNQLLVGGFASLGQALNQLGDRLSESLDALNDNVVHLINTSRHDRSKLSRSIEAVHTQLDSDSAARRAHEEKTRQLLAQIKDHTRPTN